MTPIAGRYYATQTGRVVGPLKVMNHSSKIAFWFDDCFEPGIWDSKGHCDHPLTKTGMTYGNLVQEVSKPVDEDDLIE